MSSKQDLLIRLDTEFGDKGFKSAEASAKVLEREMNKLEAAERSMAAMQIAAAREGEARHAKQLQQYAMVGKGAVVMGGAIAAGLGLAGKAAMDWESAWTGVTKTVDGSAEEMAALEKDLRGLSLVLPETHDQIAGVAEAAGQLGVARKDVASFTKTMVMLGDTTNLTSDEAATGMAQLGNIMGVTADQASRAGAALVALGNDGASTEADILAMSLRLAGAGKTIGLTEAQVMGFANALASMGIEAEAGGSAMSTTFVKIASAVADGGAAVQGFADVAGKSTAEFSQMFKTDAAGAVTAFVQGLGRVQASGQNVFATLKDLGLGEIRVRDTLLRAANAGDLLSHSLERGTQAWQDNMALVQEAEKRYATAESRIAIARNTLTDAAIDIGAVVLPAFAGAAETVGFLAKAFLSLPEPVKTAVAVLGAVATAALLAGGAALMLAPKLAAAQAALTSMGTAGALASRGLGAAAGVLAGPWGIALAGATLALGVWASKNAESEARVSSLTTAIKASGDAFSEQSRQAAVSDLMKDGTLKRFADLGIAANDVTDAMMGIGDARDRVRGALSDIENQALKTGVSFDEYGNSSSAAYDESRKLQGVLTDSANTFGTARDAADLSASAMKDNGAAANTAAGATEALAKSQEYLEKAAEDSAKALKKLIDQVKGYGSDVLDAREAARGYADAIDGASEALKKNGKTLDTNTEKGRANQEALEKIATSALDVATANFKNGDSLASVTKKVDAARGQFITFATKMGMSKTAAARLADQLGLTRSNVETLGGAVKDLPAAKNIIITAVTDTAQTKLSGILTMLANINGKTVTVKTRYVQEGYSSTGGRSTAGGITKADGGILHFASGGFAGQLPQIQYNHGPAGITWAETGAGPWEAFISGDPGKASRSRSIWYDVGRRLGTIEAKSSRPTVVVQGGGTATLAESDRQLMRQVLAAVERPVVVALDGHVLARSTNAVNASRRG